MLPECVCAGTSERKRAFAELRSMQVDRGIAIADLITALHETVLRGML